MQYKCLNQSVLQLSERVHFSLNMHSINEKTGMLYSLELAFLSFIMSDGYSWANVI